jgi:hypothetical protein
VVKRRFASRANILIPEKISAREVVATHRLADIPNAAANFLGCDRAIPF